ncbi:hypothetical protein JTB14_008832 [Gonioctena quinquepunctata]|nr:hypothetical protein JTB14_008832 [Gonioctena quinquepunctata]
MLGIPSMHIGSTKLIKLVLQALDWYLVNSNHVTLLNHLSLSKLPVHLSQLTLADPNFNMFSPIDMLLGADVFPQILIGNKIIGSRVNEPFAIETVLGWIVMDKAASFSGTPVNSLEQVPDVMSRSPQDEKYVQRQSYPSYFGTLCDILTIS